MKYTKEEAKQLFLDKEICLINDNSKELRDLLIEWFPEDNYFETRKDCSDFDNFIYFCSSTWMSRLLSDGYKPISIKDIETENTFNWADLEWYNESTDKWLDIQTNKTDTKVRFKPKKDPAITELEERAKELGYKITLKKL